MTNGFYTCSKVSDGLASWCKPCFRSYRVADHNVHPERKRRHREMAANWQKANPQKALARVKRYQARHRERVLDHARQSAKRRLPRILAKNAKRRGDQLHATPSWANLFFIEEIYDLARLRSKYLGEQHVVDHVIPLKHPLVCGLHVETNLRVVPHRVNAAKGNSYIP